MKENIVHAYCSGILLSGMSREEKSCEITPSLLWSNNCMGVNILAIVLKSKCVGINSFN